MSEGVHYAVELAMSAAQHKSWKTARLAKYKFKDWGPLGSAPDPGQFGDQTVAECLGELRERTSSSLPSELTDRPGVFVARGSLDGDAFDELSSAVSVAVRIAGELGATGGLTYVYDEIGGGARIVVGPVPKKKTTSLVREATDEELEAATPRKKKR